MEVSTSQSDLAHLILRMRMWADIIAAELRAELWTIPFLKKEVSTASFNGNMWLEHHVRSLSEKCHWQKTLQFAGIPKRGITSLASASPSLVFAWLMPSKRPARSHLSCTCALVKEGTGISATFWFLVEACPTFWGSISAAVGFASLVSALRGCLHSGEI